MHQVDINVNVTRGSRNSSDPVVYWCSISKVDVDKCQKDFWVHSIVTTSPGCFTVDIVAL